MNESSLNLRLTYVDQLILNSYCNIMEGLSNYLGDGYELVLHSLEDYSRSVIKIINGYHTGRKEGAPITDLALKMLKKIQDNEGSDDITYFVKNKQGEPLKSSTIVIRGEHERIIGLLCINCYLNTSVIDFFKNFVEQSEAEVVETNEHYENFSSSNIELLEDMVQQVKLQVLESTEISHQNKNKEIITRLHAKGVYNIKDAVVRTAQILNISKNTVYMHLRNLESDK